MKFSYRVKILIILSVSTVGPYISPRVRSMEIVLPIEITYAVIYIKISYIIPTIYDR